MCHWNSSTEILWIVKRRKLRYEATKQLGFFRPIVPELAAVEGNSALGLLRGLSYRTWAFQNQSSLSESV